MTSSSWASRLYKGSGLASVIVTGRDAWLIIFARTCRMFAYGSGSLILALFFAELGVSDSRIGLFMTLTLVGDVGLSLGLTLVADWLGRRRTLLFGSVVMILSGTIFATCENYWLLLFAAVVGVISATGGDFGPFRAIEESTLSELTTPDTRADVLVWYVTTSTLGSSLGTEMSGRIVEYLRRKDGWTLRNAYHGVFWIYVIMGVMNIIYVLLLSSKCELQQKGGSTEQAESIELSGDDSSIDGEATFEPKTPPRNKLARISRDTLSVISILWALLMVDSLADGMASITLTSYYMDQKFDLAKSTIGDSLSISYVASSFLNILAGPLSRRIGLVNTMVFTHIPSSAAVLLFPWPSGTFLTFTLLFIRVALNPMDQGPRAALIAAVVRSEERTAVMGITSMLRTVASTVGPSITGVLAGSKKFWIAFVVAGALRLAYDVGLFVMFLNINLHKYEPVATGDDTAAAAESRRHARESVVDEEEAEASDNLPGSPR